MISIKCNGDFKNIEGFFNRAKKREFFKSLELYAKRGVDALANNTPKDTEKTSSSWKYNIIMNSKQISIEWINTNINKGVSIAAVIQYGHVTKNGRFIRGIDYINPAIRPVFIDILNSVWDEVIR